MPHALSCFALGGNDCCPLHGMYVLYNPKGMLLLCSGMYLRMAVVAGIKIFSFQASKGDRIA